MSHNARHGLGVTSWHGRTLVRCHTMAGHGFRCHTMAGHWLGVTLAGHGLGVTQWVRCQDMG